MVNKVAAVVFGLVCYNLVFAHSGMPRPGTIGFLLLVNCFQVFMFMAYPMTVRYVRHAYAGMLSLLAILVRTLALFRASEVTVGLLSVASVWFSMMALYLFTLTSARFDSIGELLGVPVLLLLSWLKSVKHLFFVWLPVGFGWLGSTLLRDSERKNTTSELVLGAAVGMTLVLLLLMGGLLGLPAFYAIVDEFFIVLLSRPFDVSIETTRQVSITIWLIFGLVPLAMMKTEVQRPRFLTQELLPVLIMELSMVVMAGILILGAFLISQAGYLFGLVTFDDLQVAGVASYSDYVQRGFKEFGVISLGVAVVVLSSVVVLRMHKKSIASLRWVNLGLLSLWMIFTAALGWRLSWYMWFHGLTRARFYGMVVVVVLAIVVIIMVVRLVKNYYEGWHFFEMGMLVICLFGVGLIDVDGWLAGPLVPRVNGDVDYVYISRLSVDGVEGWLAAVNQADGVVMSLQEKNLEMSERSVRQLVYADESVRQLKFRYLELAQRYGVWSDVEKLGGDWAEDRGPRWKQLIDMGNVNFAEWNGYGVLRNGIPPDIFVRLEQQVSVARTELDEVDDVVLDRSYAAPLLASYK